MPERELDPQTTLDVQVNAAAAEAARRDRETAARLQAAVEEQLRRSGRTPLATLATQHGRQF